MATTSTNKQPLLVDRVFHEVVNTNRAYNNTLDVQGTNSAALLISCIGTDGAIAEYIYCISRGAEHTVNFYLSTSNDYLRESESFFIGSVSSSATVKEVAELVLPKCLTPVPHVGTAEPKNSALYIPANKALWVARDGNSDVGDGPLVGAQGGYY